MEVNGVTKAKKAVNLSKKNIKKLRKQEKKSAKKAEKRERKDIKSAYIKALRKGNSEKSLAIIAVLLTVAPFVAQFVVDLLDKKEDK
ncbi:hypothetical protein SAMN02910369_02734 [Lachnospiraceae bacterium NE2001]|nr:hypothetical protein SAMN02910369_02734 [Lachnospiraceae bacterium NE2001]